jgi:hypothetical protein
MQMRATRTLHLLTNSPHQIQIYQLQPGNQQQRLQPELTTPTNRPTKRKVLKLSPAV